ncbi:hypothetical protein CFIO01_09958 [Colletotrichum fioriniae PJ7]|uniref:Uncharacterized protein n=1 Tax=Colletotrichum fioriniae PJ7 TaxID=1445577 RepID=A0A010RY68_9PEZI|nr:hypothetical protein CFIO01_09958 [Colletotrichum fioriniae PJ7]
MSSQIPRPASTTTNSSTSTSSTSTTRQFSGSMDAYTLSMYEHTQRLMAAAQIPYTSPLSITSPGERTASGTASVVPDRPGFRFCKTAYTPRSVHPPRAFITSWTSTHSGLGPKRRQLVPSTLGTRILVEKGFAPGM